MSVYGMESWDAKKNSTSLKSKPFNPRFYNFKYPAVYTQLNYSHIIFEYTYRLLNCHNSVTNYFTVIYVIITTYHSMNSSLRTYRNLFRRYEKPDVGISFDQELKILKQKINWPCVNLNEINVGMTTVKGWVIFT